MEFDELGRLTALKDRASDTSFIRATVDTNPLPAFIIDAYSANQGIYIDDPLLTESGGFCHADPGLLFSTNRSGDLYRLSIDPTNPPHIAVAETEAGQVLSCRAVLPGDIHVAFTVALPTDGDSADWRMTVANEADTEPRKHLRVYRVLFPLLSGLRVGDRAEDNRLARPFIQGELIPNPSQHDFMRPTHTGATVNVLTYPGWASMPWMDLYASPTGRPDQATGLYFASYDPTFRQVDIETVPDAAAGTVAMGMRTLAFMEPGERWESQRFVVALHEGDWHAAADRYRTDSTAWFEPRNVPAWVNDSDGWFGSGGPNYRYADLPDMLEEARWLGLNYVQCWSEMLENVGPGKSRKAYYCFFLPDPDRGGEKGMRAGVRAVRKAGGHIGFYSNFWTWDADVGRCLQQWKPHIPRDVKIPYWSEFGRYMSVFPDGHRQAGDYYDGYSGACPGAAGWRDYLHFWIADKYVRQYGVDAWYLDSFPVTMFGAARVCFSPHHAGGRPHGAGAELLRFVETLRRKTSRKGGLAVTCESVNDVFMQHNSHALGLELIEGITLYPKPEIYTYTFPHHPIFSGRCNGAGSGLKYYYDDVEGRGSRTDTLNRVFLMGYRFDVLGYKLNRKNPDMLYLRDLIGLRQRIKDDLYRSSFRDELGLGRLPANVWAKVFRHDAGTSLAIVFLDRRVEKAAFTLHLDPSAHSVSRAGRATLYTLDGADVGLDVGTEPGGVWTIDVPTRAGDPAALLIRCEG